VALHAEHSELPAHLKPLADAIARDRQRVEKKKRCQEP